MGDFTENLSFHADQVKLVAPLYRCIQFLTGVYGWYGYGSIPIDIIFSGMNIHFNPAILMWTKKGYQGFDTLPIWELQRNL